MELRPGYKETEVGVIPEDWEVRPVRDFAQIRTGPFGTLLKASEYTGTDGVPLISVGEIGGGYFRITDETPRVPVEVVRRLPQYVLGEGDIVFGRKGAVDRSALITKTEKGWFLGSDGMAIRPHHECYPPYLACQFQRSEVQGWLRQQAIGTTMPSLNQGILERVQIPYAPALEQRAIATALSDVDALLDGLTKLIAKKRDLKQAAMQQLLTGQIRLPGFDGEWEVKRLGEVAVHCREKNSEARALPVLTCSKHLGFIDSLSYFKNQVFSKDLSNYKLIVRGQIGYPANHIEEGSIGLQDLYDVALVSPIYVVFQPLAQVNSYFLHRLLKLDSFRQTFAAVTASSVDRRGSLRWSTFSELYVNLPPLPEQTAIASVLSDMDAELAALEARHEKTRALKQAMMQELLTGRTRLPLELGTSESEAVPVHTRSRSANVHFKRSVLAAEIIDRLHEEPTFGHTKLMKLLFLAEHLGGIDLGSNYHRDAAGPYDNRAIRSIDNQLRRQKWFDAQRTANSYRYLPMENRGKHTTYFNRYFGDIHASLDRMINTFRPLRTKQCEIVATLFGAWHDLLLQGVPPSDDAILDEVLNRWHESKREISEDRWRSALTWMRKQGFVPEEARDA